MSPILRIVSAISWAPTQFCRASLTSAKADSTRRLLGERPASSVKTSSARAVLAATAQERHVIEPDRGVEIGHPRRVGELLLGELDRSAALVGDRQLQHQLGRARLIVERLAQVGDGGIELPALHADGGAQPQAR